MEPDEVKEGTVDAMRALVWQEIEEFWKSRHQQPDYEVDRSKVEDLRLWESSQARRRSGKIQEYLNNFFCRLPGDPSRETVLANPQFADSLHKQGESGHDYSPLMLTKTHKEFYKDFDRAMGQAGISEEEFKKLKEAAETRSNDTEADIQYNLYEQPKSLLKFNEALLEVFIRLRLMGYNPKELRA